MQAVNGQQQEDRVVAAEDEPVGKGRHSACVWGSIIVLFAASISFPWLARQTTLQFLAAYLIAAMVWLYLVTAGRAGSRTVSIPLLLLLAVGMRLPVMVGPPALSGDVYRYLWDGRVGESGINPYELPPASVELKHLRKSWHRYINHPEIRTIYPPLAQMVFTGWAHVSDSLTAWKLLLLIGDMITILLLYRLSAHVAMAYATSPLVLVEGFWSGHIEVLVTCCLVGAVFVMKKNPRSIAAAVLIGAASGLKLTPIAALPAFIRVAGNRILFAVVVIAALLLPALPYLSGSHFMSGLGTYATRWSFNSPVYDAINSAVVETGVTGGLRASWSVVKDPLNLETISDAVYRHLYADFVVRAVMGLLLVWGLWLSWRSDRSLASSSASMMGTLFLFSPTVHPWYWMPVLALALVERRWLWILLGTLAPVSYLSYDGGAPGRIAAYAVGYGIPFALAAVIEFRERGKDPSLSRSG